MPGRFCSFFGRWSTWSTQRVKNVFWQLWFLLRKPICCKWKRSENYRFVPKFVSNMALKYSIGVMIITWVIIKGLKKEFVLVFFCPTKTNLFYAWLLFSWHRLMYTLLGKLDFSVVIKSFPKNWFCSLSNNYIH